MLCNLMTLTSFVFTELANAMKYGGRGIIYIILYYIILYYIILYYIILYYIVYIYIILFSPSDVTTFHRMKYGGGGVI